MTSTLDLSVASENPIRLRFVKEITLFAIGSAFTAGLAVATSAYLLDRASVDLLEGGFAGYQALALAILVLILGLRFAYFLALALVGHWRRERAVDIDPARWPRVSILVPAHNEAETIAAALQSSLEIDYPNFEIVVVDDGSTDETLAIARGFEGSHGGVHVRVFEKPNAGKWSAHNLAFRHAEGEMLLCVDADSRLEPASLRHLVRALLRDPRAGGVAGQVRVRNRDRILTRLQALEYLNCNGSTRSAQSSAGSVLVVPGPIGLFYRHTLEAVHDRFGRHEMSAEAGEFDGPYENDTFAEDFDLSIAVLALEQRVIYEPRAISQTKAPDSVLALLNQRYRWQRGSIQVLRKFFRRASADSALMNPRLVHWVLLTYIVDLALIPLWLLLGLPYVVMTFLNGGVMATNLFELFVLFQGLNLLLAFCYASTHGDRKRVALVLPFHDLYQTFLLQGILFFVIYDEIRGAPMRWS